MEDYIKKIAGAIRTKYFSDTNDPRIAFKKYAQMKRLNYNTVKK